jgi:type I restriction enzyme S subunit
MIARKRQTADGESGNDSLIPTGWKSLKLSQVSGTITTGRLDANAMRENGEYPFFTCARDVYRIDAFAFDADALMVSGNGANVGYIHHYCGKFNAYQRTYVLTDFLANTQFLKAQLENGIQERIRTEVNAGNTPYILKGTLADMQISLPNSVAEQQAIAEALSDADGVVEGLERLIEKKRCIKQGAMQDLLTAKRRLPGFSGEWVKTTFGQCYQFLRTGSASRSQLGTNLGVGYIHYGDIHGINSAVLDLSKSRLPEIPHQAVATLSRVQDGDLVIADASEDIMDVGKSVEVKGVRENDVVSGLHTFLLRGNPAIVANGFKAYIQFLRDVRTGIESIATGSSVYGISKTNLAKLKFRVPPVSEQAAIGKLFADMDAEITALEARLQKARAIKEGMMQNLLTGRIRLV